jgi:hypothetical protein
MNQPAMNAWNEPSQLCRFLERFAYMFPLAAADRRRSYVFFRGWMPAFAFGCEQIDSILGADKRYFAWTRIREKFGAPSLAYQMRGQARHVIHAHRPTEVRRICCAPRASFEPLAVAIQEAVLLVEMALRESCIVCAAPSLIVNAGGPWASLCGEHRESAFLKNLEDISLWKVAELSQI